MGTKKYFPLFIRRQAFSLVEIVIAVAFIVTILAGANGIFAIGIRNAKKGENMSIAQGLGQELLEQTLSRDFTLMTDTPSASVGLFSRSSVVTENYQGNPRQKLITVTVSGPQITNLKLYCLVTDPSITP